MAKETALGPAPGYTPNAFINTDDGRLVSTVWQGKICATLSLPLDLRLTPIVRHQSGDAVRAHLHPAVQLGQRHDARRTDRRAPDAERDRVRHPDRKSVRTRAGRLAGFFDVYNIFNTNAEQEITTTSGARSSGRSRSRRRASRGSA